MTEHRFLRAARGERPETTPVWIMRQAGRYLPQYRAIREKVDFLTLCKTPALAAEVTVQPVEAIGVDAAIQFADILLPLEAMGLPLELGDKGPHLPSPVRTEADIERLVVPDVRDRLGYVMEAISLSVKSLAGRVPLIGFAGAPWTLLAYAVEGGGSKSYLHAKRLLFERPDLAERLFEKLTQTTIAYLTAQLDAGAQAVQLFDSWAGELHPGDYLRLYASHVARIVEAVKRHRPDAPFIYFGTGMSGMLELLPRLGADVIGCDWRVLLSTAVERLGEDVVVQGNLDPAALFLPLPALRDRVKETLVGGAKAKAHIFNLGHGILPETDPARARALVELVHELGTTSR